MPTTSSAAARVLLRYLSAASPRKKTAAVVLTDSPRGWDWGWLANAEPRLHLVPMKAGHHRDGVVYLEDRHGRRVFRPEGRIPTDMLIELATEVDLHDIEIETAWCWEAAARGWLNAQIDPVTEMLRLNIYLNTPNERERKLKINWPKIIGSREPTPDDVVINAEHSVLIVGAREARPIRVPLRHVVFQTRGAVLDGVVIIEPDHRRDQWVNSTPKRRREGDRTRCRSPSLKPP